MRMLVIAFAVSIAFGLPWCAADDPAKPSAEMLLLADFVGTWDEEMTGKPTEWVPNAVKSTAVTKRSWAMGGKFIQGEGAWIPDKNAFLHLMGYDADAKVYRTYYFDSAGTMPRSIAKGEWDAKTRTLSTIDTDEGGNKTTVTHTVKDKDTTEWTMIVTNPAGKVVLDFAGKCKRRKE